MRENDAFYRCCRSLDSSFGSPAQFVRCLVSIRRNIGLNFLGNAWNGLLIIVSTPWYISMLGLEGYGLVGFWQLLLYVFLIFDFGLGASVVREFAAYRGSGREAEDYRSLLVSVERVCLLVAVPLSLVIFSAAPWFASGWLRLETVAPEQADLSIRFMSVTIATQLLAGLYSNGLNGLQNHGAMNALLMLGQSLRYLGGGLVLHLNRDIVMFFAFQGCASLVVTGLTRAILLRRIGVKQRRAILESTGLHNVRRYAGGMFVTALLGMLLVNADRILLSKLVTTENLGRYSLAFAGAGFLQMVVFAFYRSYFPIFAQLRASGDSEKLKSTYYSACRQAGLFIVPAAVIGWLYSSELIVVWIGTPDAVVAQIFRLLVLGTSCAGLMWLPAAYQQATGWTTLHSGLMGLALALGGPITFFAIQRLGAVGGTTMMLLHGAIEITLGLWLMNRVLFQGETTKWYRNVVLLPLGVTLPMILLSKQIMPEDLVRWSIALWIALTCLILLPCLVVAYRKISLEKTE